MKKIITTGDVPRHKVDDREQPGGRSVITGRPAGLSAMQYIEKFGTVEEKNELASRISERRSKLPKFVFLICDSCGWRMKTLFGDRDVRPRERPEYCLSCNRQGYKDGASMRLMKKAEIMAFEKEAADKEARARERTKQAALFNNNLERQKKGLAPLSSQEFEAQRAHAYRAMIKASRGGAK